MEMGPGQWYLCHLSPARARVMVEHLKRYIKHIEKVDGAASGCIDEPTETLKMLQSEKKQKKSY